WQEASLFAEVYERIKRDYVDDVDDHALMEKALRGMVAALDPHSAYLDSEEFEEIRLSTMGSYPGVGIEVAAEDGVVKVLHPIEGSPAQQAGLEPGDELVRVDGNDIGADLAGAMARPDSSSTRCAAPRSKCTASCSRALSQATDTCESRASARPRRVMSAGRLPD